MPISMSYTDMVRIETEIFNKVVNLGRLNMNKTKAYIDTRSKWPIYINGMIAIELRDMTIKGALNIKDWSHEAILAFVNQPIIEDNV